MTLPYSTSTAGERALAELQRTLAKFGCQSFGTMVDAENGETIVQFRHRGRDVMLKASWRGYAAALMAQQKRKPTYGMRDKIERKAIEQAKMSVCSVLRDWVKGQVTAVECGMMTFDAAFLSHMLLPTGERVLDRVQTQGLLPKPMEKTE